MATTAEKRARSNFGGGGGCAPPLPPSLYPIAGLPADARARIVACLSLGALVRLGPDIAVAFLNDDEVCQQWPVLRRLRREGGWGAARVVWVEKRPVSGSAPLCLPSACRWWDVSCAVALALKRCVQSFCFGCSGYIFYPTTANPYSWRPKLCYSDALDQPGHLHAGGPGGEQA